MGKYVIRIDDVAPNMHWERYQTLVDLCEEYGIYPLLGVIPDNKDPDLLHFHEGKENFWDHIRKKQQKGATIALHGLHHQFVTNDSGILDINPRSEFAGLPVEEQEKKVRKGLEIFSNEGVTTSVFMPPAHSFDLNTLEAMKHCGLSTLTDGYGFYPYWDDGVLFVPQQVATPRSFPFGVYTFCFHPNGMDASDFTHLRSFLSKHNQDVISFEEAAQRQGRCLPQKVAGALMKQVLMTKRRAAYPLT